MVSAVVASRNRPEDLQRLVSSLERLGPLLKEIIIIDSSDLFAPLSREHYDMGRISIQHIPFSPPSLSHQRNHGISMAKEEYVLLCDDDLEFPGDYLQRLIPPLKIDPTMLIVTGNCSERSENGEWESTIPQARLRHMLWSWFFQLGLWKSVVKRGVDQGGGDDSWLTKRLKQYYKNRGNSLSSAGWPLITQLNSGRFHSEVFTLGGAVFRSAWLKQHLFDEKLEPYGIGDHFDICLSAAREHPVEVFMEAEVKHYRSPLHRSNPGYTHARRVYALQYFLIKHGKWSTRRATWFIWSLCGQLIYFTLTGKGKLALASLNSTVRVILGRNPLLE